MGAPAVQQLRGAAYDRQWAIFHSLSPYTAVASDFADSAGAALFSYDLAGNVAAVNGPARSLAATAGVDEGGHWAVVAQQVIDILSENSKSLQYLLASSNGSVDSAFLESLEAIILSNRRAASMLSIDVDRISRA